jgi:hypothetical protein
MRLLGRLRSRSGWSSLHRGALLVALGTLGCGGGDDDERAADTFTATEPPDDVCSLLAAVDLATLLASNDGGMPDRVQANADIWLRTCTYTSDEQPSQQVDLVLEGAMSQAGSDLIHKIVGEGPGDALTEHVDGVGETATYWADDAVRTLGLISAWHDHAIGVTAYFVDPPPSKDKLVPLVVKVIGKLP